MNRLITLLVGLIVTINLYSQEWFPTGASWHYNQVILGEGETYSYFEITGDTLIQGKDCKIISGYCSCGVPNVGRFLYEEGGKVYAYDDEADTFRILYDFTLVAGDTLVFEGDPKAAGDGIFLIDSITYIQAGSLNLKVQHITSLSFYVAWGDQIIERIGSSLCLYPQNAVCDPLTGGLRCYEDPQIGLINFQNPERPCDYITTGTNEPTEAPYVNVYPNPTTGAFRIESKQIIKKIELLNSLSILSYQNIGTGTTYAEIDMGSMPPGLYYLKVTTSNNNLVVKPIIIQ